MNQSSDKKSGERTVEVYERPKVWDVGRVGQLTHGPSTSSLGDGVALQGPRLPTS